MIPAIFAAVTILTGIGGADPYPGGLAPRLQDILTGCSAISVFIVANLLIRGKARFFTNTQVWGAAAFAASAIPFLVDLSIRRQPNWYLGLLALFGVISYTAAIGAIGLIWTGWRGSKALRLELARENQSLRERQRKISKDIEFVKTRNVKDVRNQLLEALNALSPSNLATPNFEADQYSGMLLDLVDQVIRPLSKELSSNSHPESQAAVASTTLVPKTERLPVSDSQLLSPLLYSGIFLLFSVSPAVVFFGTPGLIFELATVLLTSLVHVFLRKLSRGRVDRKGFAGWIISSATAMPSVIYAWFAFEDERLVSLALTMILGHFLTSFIITSFLWMTASRVNALNELSLVRNENEKLVARLKQEEWFERERLARLVHGQVQSKVLIAALRLSRDDGKSIEAITDAGLDIISAIEALDNNDNVSPSSFGEQFDNLKDAWRGACELSLKAEQQTLIYVSQDEIASACLIEIIREGVANAAKHSKAEDCTIEIHLGDDSKVNMALSAPGSLSLDSARTNGFGTQLLNELASAWELSGDEHRVTLLATVELRSTPN